MSRITRAANLANKGSVATASSRQAALADQLYGLARAEGWRVGRHLMEQELAAQLDVSRSPVRALLKYLAAQGFVEYRLNKGCFLAVDASHLPSAVARGPSGAADKIYRSIIDDKLNERVPERFTTSELCEKYHVSRPVLEGALQRLVQDGLLLRNKGQGWSFIPSLTSVSARHASYEFRIMIEPNAVLLPSFKVRAAVLDDLKARHLRLLSDIDQEGLQDAAIYATDAAFHHAIAEFSGNAFVVNTLDHHNRLRQLLEFSTYVNKRRVKQWCVEHLSIIAALEVGDRKLASALLREHLLAANGTLGDDQRNVISAQESIAIFD